LLEREPAAKAFSGNPTIKIIPRTAGVAKSTERQEKMASEEQPARKRFEPKEKVNLDPPKDDPISIEYLSKCDGKHEGYPTYVAIKVRHLCLCFSVPCEHMYIAVVIVGSLK